MDRDEIRALLEGWSGQTASWTLQLRRPTDADDDVMGELDILVFELDDGEPDEKFTTLITAGISTERMKGPLAHLELMLSLNGDWSEDLIRELAHKLGEIAVLPFRQGTYHAPLNIIANVDWPIFGSMKNALITNFPPSQGTHLGGESGFTLLLIRPLFPTEAEVFKKVGLKAFEALGYPDWFDPERLAHEPDYDALELTESSIPEPGYDIPEDVEDEIRSIWKDIDAWLAEHSPETLERLGDGAEPEDLDSFEFAIGYPLSPGLRASLLVHNGAAYLTNYETLTFNGIMASMESWTESLMDGDFDHLEPRPCPELQPGWWRAGWIPFAEDSGGNALCVDMDPGPGGVIGQVIAWERQTGPEPLSCPSFYWWLRTYRDDLYAGKYHVDDTFGIILI